MRKLIGFVALLGLWAFPASYSEISAKEAPPAMPAQVNASAGDAQRAEMRKKTEAKKAELNGSEWEVTLINSADPKAAPEKDVLTFQNGQVNSKSLAGRGFKPTNYTITLQEGSDETVWETMQTSPSEGVVFIRGEWKDDAMRGIVSQQLEGGKTRDYSFTTSGKTTVSPTTPKEEKQANETAAAIAVPPAQNAAAPAAKSGSGSSKKSKSVKNTKY